MDKFDEFKPHHYIMVKIDQTMYDIHTILKSHLMQLQWL